MLDYGYDPRQEILVAQTRQDKVTLHATDIWEFRATPEEVEEWHFSADPLNGAMILALDIASAKGDRETHDAIRRELVEEQMLTDRGGMTLLASVLYPDIFEQAQARGISWIDSFSDDSNWEKPTQRKLFDACHQRLINEPLLLDDENADRLLIAAEMIRGGAGALMKVLEKAGIEVHESDGDIKRLLQEKNNLAHLLFKIIAGQARVLTSENSASKEVDRARMRGLKAQMFYASTFMSVSFEERPDLEAAADEQFIELIGLIKHTLGNPDDSITERLMTRQIRGSLHELMWFVDAYAMRRLQPQIYGEVRVIPAMSHEDAPRNGFPAKKRNIDMRVRFGELHDKVQLKSSSEHRSSRKNNYNEQIIKLCEVDFRDVQPAILLEKLNTYLQWAENGFDPVMVGRVERYLIDTVRKEFADITSRQSDRTTDQRISMADAILRSAMKPNIVPAPRNRAERRARARGKKPK